MEKCWDRVLESLNLFLIGYLAITVVCLLTIFTAKFKFIAMYPLIYGFLSSESVERKKMKIFLMGNPSTALAKPQNPHKSYRMEMEIDSRQICR